MEVSHTAFPMRHQQAMRDPTNPIHAACDFFVPRSPNTSLDIEAVNAWVHSSRFWAPWPEFLVAFASQGCGDYFAYDLRQSPPSVIYLGTDHTPEELLRNPEALRYDSFDSWYESQVA